MPNFVQIRSKLAMPKERINKQTHTHTGTHAHTYSVLYNKIHA